MDPSKSGSIWHGQDEHAVPVAERNWPVRRKHVAAASRDALYETMRMRMEGMDSAARACVCNHIYYLAMCIKESESDVLSENNTVLEYDTERGTFMVRKGMRVKDFFSVGGTVYFTQAGRAV